MLGTWYGCNKSWQMPSVYPILCMSIKRKENEKGKWHKILNPWNVSSAQTFNTQRQKETIHKTQPWHLMQTNKGKKTKENSGLGCNYVLACPGDVDRPGWWRQPSLLCLGEQRRKIRQDIFSKEISYHEPGIQYRMSLTWMAEMDGRSGRRTWTTSCWFRANLMTDLANDQLPPGVGSSSLPFSGVLVWGFS